MADLSEDDTCDQTEQISGTENQAVKSGDSLPHYAQYNPPANMDAGSATSRQNLSLDSQDTLPPGYAALPNNEDTSSANSMDPPPQTTASASKDDPSVNNSPPNKGGSYWGYAAAAGLGATVTGGAAVAAAPLILTAAGFTAGGVAAGSIAAAIQSAFYGGSVGAGSAFALLQSAGTGIGLLGNSAIFGTGATVGGLTSAIGAKLFNSGRNTIKVLICGSGNGAHAFAGIASSLEGTEVRVLSLYQDEEKLWNAAMKENNLEVIIRRKGEEPARITSKLALVTNNPEDVIGDVDIAVFVLPAFAHQVYFDALKPHIKPGTILVGLPGGPGFDFQVRHVLGETGHQCTIMNFESSPWVCHTTEFGVKCEVLGTMKQGGVAPKKDPFCTLQYLLGPLELPVLSVSGHMLGVQLMSVNAYLHTSLMYGQWEGWDGNPLDEPPLFYCGLTESTANLLSSVSDEILNISITVEMKTEADMSEVVHIHNWHIRRYRDDIVDKTSLKTAIQTNAAYQGIRHPVKRNKDGKFTPDFTCCYMTEDVPYGLVVIRGIAEIVRVETPNVDKLLTWCQRKMEKEYLVNSKLQGRDVVSSGAPQRYGLTTLASIL